MQNPREVQAAREAQLRAQVQEAMAAAKAAAQAQSRAIEGKPLDAEGQIRAEQRAQLGYQDAFRQSIRRELEQLENRRDEISSQLQNPMVSGANRGGLERRIQQIDSRIAALETQSAELDARASGTASTLLPARPAGALPPPNGGDDPFMVIGGLFMLCVALPLSIAYARRIWRRGGDAIAAIPADIAARLGRIEQNVDTVALEVERIGESQRFITRAFSEQRGLQPGGSEPVAAEREKEFQRRSP